LIVKALLPGQGIALEYREQSRKGDKTGRSPHAFISLENRLAFVASLYAIEAKRQGF
jgi:hypothetical protein